MSSVVPESLRDVVAEAAREGVECKDITLCCSIEALVYGGLAIHKGVNKEGYTLTHLASSLSLATGIDLPLKERIKVLMEVAGLMDWTLSYDEIMTFLRQNEQEKTRIFALLNKLKRV